MIGRGSALSGRTFRAAWLAVLPALAIGMIVPDRARAASLSASDAQFIAKALGFQDPPAPAGIIAVVYAGGNAASEADANGITALFAGGLSSSGGSVTVKPVAIAALGDGSGYVAIILASGGQGDAVMAAVKAHKILCISGDPAIVQAGQCIMAVRSQPSVDITVNRAVAQAAGIGFASAFTMLIHEI